MKPTVKPLINPVTIRFSLHNGNPIYHFTSDPDTQLDGIENHMGVDIENNPIFDQNLGFLPIATSTLIQGDETIVVDPGNFHMGSYGMVQRALGYYDLEVQDVDTVVITHSHHDHMGSTFLFEDSTMIIGEGELEFAREVYWPEFIDAITVDRVDDVRFIEAGDGMTEICEGVSAFSTPGHTPASISLWVEVEEEDVAVIGDVAMAKTDYTERDLSHWYTDEQVDGIYASMDRIEGLGPDRIIPGHDLPFEP